MAKTVKSDRQAKIDQIRKQQKGADARRNVAIIGTCAVIALLIVGAAAYQPLKSWWDLRAYDDAERADIGAPASVCQDPITKPAEAGDHIDRSQQATYEDAPPATGPHWNEAGLAPVPIGREFYTVEDALEPEQLLHNMEHGFTVLWYDESIADDPDTITELRAIARTFSDTSDRRNAFIIAPWTSEQGADFPDGQVLALTHWSAGGGGETDTSKQVGVWQYCSEVSGEAVESFVRAYPSFDSPEGSAVH